MIERGTGRAGRYAGGGRGEEAKVSAGKMARERQRERETRGERKSEREKERQTDRESLTPRKLVVSHGTRPMGLDQKSECSTNWQASRRVIVSTKITL